MIEIMGNKFLTDKEAAERYGYSQSWFIRARGEGFGPKFIQLKDKGRVLYPVEKTDNWFREKMMEKE